MQKLFAPKQRTAVISSRRQAAMLAVAAAYVILWTAGVADHWIGPGRTTDHGWLASLSLLLAAVIVIIGADYSSDLEQRNSAHFGFVGCGRESRLALVAQDAAARFRENRGLARLGFQPLLKSQQDVVLIFPCDTTEKFGEHRAGKKRQR